MAKRNNILTVKLCSVQKIHCLPTVFWWLRLRITD